MAVVTFKQVVKEAQASVKTSTGLWNTMVMFVHDQLSDQFKAGKDETPQGKGLKEAFKENEERVKVEDKVALNTIGAYRSTKSVISAACRYGVSITANGKARGKTDVEKEIDLLREPEAPIKTIERSFKAIMGKCDKVTDHIEVRAMYATAAQCMEMVKKHAATVLEVKGTKLEKTLATEKIAA